MEGLSPADALSVPSWPTAAPASGHPGPLKGPPGGPPPPQPCCPLPQGLGMPSHLSLFSPPPCPWFCWN